MFKKLALLVAALTLAMPVFAADTTTPAASAPTASADAKPPKKHHKKKVKTADAAKTDAATAPK